MDGFEAPLSRKHRERPPRNAAGRGGGAGRGGVAGRGGGPGRVSNNSRFRRSDS